MISSFKKYSVVFFALLLFSGCPLKKEEEVTEELPPKTVPVVEITPGEFQETLEISGTLRPAFEARVGSEASGTISQIYAHEGDEVVVGQILAQISASDNRAQIERNNARIALQNARAQWELSKKQAEVQEKSAEIQIGKAEIDLLSADRSNSSTDISVKAQEESSKSGVEIAKLTLQNATETSSELKENLDLQENILKEREENIIASTVVSFRNALEGSDAILGFSQERKRDNDTFEIYLAFNDPQIAITAELLAKKTWKEFLVAEKKYYANPQDFSSADILKSAKKIQEVLAETSKVLQSSTTGERLSATQLAQFQGSIAQYRLNIEGNITQLSDMAQVRNDFSLKKPQQIRAAEIAISQAQDRLQQSERNLEQVKSGGVVNTSGTEGRFDAAQKGVEIAKLQYELTKQQGEIAIQQAKSQVDVAQSQVEAAELALSKLSITAPFSGIITKKNIDIGDTINMGSPLFVLSDINQLLLKGDIAPSFLPHIFLGQIAFFPFPAGEREGLVSRINAVANDTTKRIDIEIALPNEDRSVPANIFLTAKIPLISDDDAITIPYGSLISHTPPRVFLVGEGEKGSDPAFFLEKRTLTLGKKSGDIIRVSHGLLKGDLLVVSPLLGLREGDEVLPEKKNISEEKAPSEQFSLSQENIAENKEQNLGLRIIEPREGQEFQNSPILFQGVAPEKTMRVEVNKYTLQSFSLETGEFLYRADPKFKNLKKGKNLYEIQAFDEEGNLLETISLSLFFSPL